MRRVLTRKALALPLACLIALSCTLTAAFAAYSDQSQITHAEAVDALTTLHVLSGMEDGSFQPLGTLTRAEMSKIIYTVRHGGAGMTSERLVLPDNFFADAKDHWAARFIHYCSYSNIIAGMGDGSFQPDAPVTGLEAAKMLLVCIGYRPDREGLTGERWAEATRELAQELGLFAGLEDRNHMQPLTRDDAAQMVYNALQAPMVHYVYYVYTPEGGEMTVTEVVEAVLPSKTLMDRF